MLTHTFLFLSAGTRDAVPFGTGHDAPFFCHVGIIRSFLWRHIVFFAHQFVARLCPISLGKLVRVALVDHGDFSGASFRFPGGWCADSITMLGNFPWGRLRVMVHSKSSEKRSCIFAIHFGLQIEALQYNYGKETAGRCIGKMSFNFLMAPLLRFKN